MMKPTSSSSSHSDPATSEPADLGPPKGRERFFAWVLKSRFVFLAIFALLTPLALFHAARLRSSPAIGALVVESDPDYAATRAFHQVFPEGHTALLLAESDAPLSAASLTEMDRLTRAVQTVPGVTAVSILELYRRAHPGFTPATADLTDFVRFASSPLLRRQGLVGPHFMSIAASFAEKGADARDRTLSAIDTALTKVKLSTVHKLRRVGAPYVESWIEYESREAQLRGLPVLALLIVVLCWILYRSLRAVFAFLLSLAAAVALSLGAGQLLGFGVTIVSALVPLTVLVTTLASLVYVHSRFVDQPPGVPLERHHTLALASKFLPVTVSSVAAILGFVALVVSPIRPIKEMGLWTALSLAVGWLVAFTLFPSLQSVLRTPTNHASRHRITVYDRLSAHIPRLSYRLRWPMLVGTLLLSVAGVVAIVGLPGVLSPMNVSVAATEYIDPSLPLYKDVSFYRDHVGGLDVAHVWVKVPDAGATDPEVLRGIEHFSTLMERVPMVTSVVGPTTFLRMRKLLAGGTADLPENPEVFATLAADLESVMLSEPALRNFIDIKSLDHVQLIVNCRRGAHQDYSELQQSIERAFKQAQADVPVLAGARIALVGDSYLQAKVGKSLVPTLTESFAITAALIFAAFLAVFRSPSARLMAMIPSLFAISTTFLCLRLVGGSLNVATIVIATTVLGTTENDQVHFFYHLQECKTGSFEQQLLHTLRVAGRAIFFATVINALGFLGLAFSHFPPLRQFGLETCVAFALAMLADFTALPGALWIVQGQKPGEPRTDSLPVEQGGAHDQGGPGSPVASTSA